MVNITLFEVHLDDSTVSANAPFRGESSTDDSDRPESKSTDGTSIQAVIGALIGLAFLAVAGAILRRKFASRGGEPGLEADPASDDPFDT